MWSYVGYIDKYSIIRHFWTTTFKTELTIKVEF